MKFFLIVFLAVFLFSGQASGTEGPVSEESTACIECHSTFNPGIVSAWKKSRMSRVIPRAAKSVAAKQRRVSFEQIPENLANVAVGCAECHTLNSEKHKDSFEHNGYKVHVVVTPQDCATCHPVEVNQFGKNLMSEAYGNLENNPVYQSLVKSVTGIQSFKGMATVFKEPDELTLSDACRQCHGTVVDVKGFVIRETDQGDMPFPVLTGWPNQGVGRINPDGSKGSCSACHTRHEFAIEMARKPYTCSQCHKGPDVPAFKVYEVSKHGNLYSALGHGWNYDHVPWNIGKDIAAPTCATCHISLVSGDGEIVANRTHQMNDRLPWRIFGPIYAHPHPKSPDTSLIRNKAGLPLPTELTGEPASEFLISAEEQTERRKTMQKVCLSCHSQTWVEGHFERFENTIQKTNEMTLAATNVILSAWKKGAASQKDGLFNEAIEKQWVEQWLFYANSTRFSSAMAGADYGVFANGRWFMAKNMQEMVDWLKFKLKAKEPPKQ
jgi:hydroxylamine dehydrogenase